MPTSDCGVIAIRIDCYYLTGIVIEYSRVVSLFIIAVLYSYNLISILPYDHGSISRYMVLPKSIGE